MWPSMHPIATRPAHRGRGRELGTIAIGAGTFTVLLGALGALATYSALRVTGG
jgi:hypothetical protein